MFTNAGKKIKTVALVLFYIFSILSLIGCLWTLIASNIKQFKITTLILTILFIASMWIICLFIYGFGELIEDNHKMRLILENDKKHSPPYTFEKEADSFLADLVRTKEEETDVLYNPIKEERNEDE